MSNKEETKQEETTPVNNKSSTHKQSKPSPAKSAKSSKSEAKSESISPAKKIISKSSNILSDKSKTKNKAELLVDQVRLELESYFAPQNIQNDYNLRQKMTTDGYIDIDILLSLKLMQDLVQDRDILINAISKSKLLVMNSARTMVKYMPLLERNVLILRDIDKDLDKKEILKIFNNPNCSQPKSLHSDIGNNWFIQFKTEEECVNTATYLQQNGTFQNKKLHVRVKAIHDKNNADQSPQNKVVNTPQDNKDIIDPSTQQPYAQIPAPYSPGYGPYYTGIPPIDPYYSGNVQYALPPQQQSPKSNNRRTRGNKRNNDTSSPPLNKTASTKIEDHTAISDYPGKFDKYSQEEFLKIFKSMKPSQLTVPQSMRGRDSRIITEVIQTPLALIEQNDDQKEKENDDIKNIQKKELSGTFYADGMENIMPYQDEEESYNEQNEYNDDDYYYYNNDDQYYYQNTPQRQRRRRGGSGGSGGSRKYYDYDNNNYYKSRNKSYSPYRGRGRGRGRNRRGRGRGGRGGGRGRGNRGYYDSVRTYKPKNQSIQHTKTTEVRWSPREPKKYSTNKGVYRTKPSSSSAY